MKYIIGLDVGTNSIGWALITEDDLGKIVIVKTGSHIFPIGTIVDDIKGKEKTKNEQRREYRGASRMRYRYKLRRENLKRTLKDAGMLPDFSKYFKIKGKQSFELYQLRANAISKRISLDEIGRIFLLLNKYRGFQSNAKKLSKEDEEAGKVKDGISQLQTFINKNEARTIGEYFFKMHQRAKELYNQNKWHNDNEPIDERALNKNGEIVLFNSNGIRRHYGRYTSRNMYKNEFDLIWTEQMKHYPKLTGSPEEYKTIRQLPYIEKIKKLKEFRNTLYWKLKEYCIYYQRPLKSQKKYVSNCQFETGKKVIPVSNPVFQEFRIYKQLADIRFNDEENYKQPLKKEWVDRLAEALLTKNKIYLKSSKNTKEKDLSTFASILNLPEGLVEFIQENPDAEKFIYGNTTYASFYESLGKEKFGDLLSKNRLELLWHHIYIAKDGLFKEDEWLEDILTSSKWNLKEEAKNLISNGLEPDYGSYSAKVIKAILPFMKVGSDENTSLVKAGYLKSPDEVSEKVSLKEKVMQLKYQELRNPVVERAVSQTIKIVNSILQNYKGVINRENFEIRIESTRELKKPRKEREAMRKSNTDKEKLRQEYADFLNSKNAELGFKRRIEKYDSLINKYELWLEMGMDDNDGKFKEDDFKAFEKITKSGDRLKHKLWKECNRICPYSGKVISLTKLFKPEIEIEHIIPLSRSLDDSYNNKTLTFYDVNKEKGTRTAYEFMKDNLKIFKRRIKSANFSDGKVNMFLKDKVNIDFSNDQISNTSYIAKYVRKKMMEVCRNVQFTNGAATAELRSNDWKLSNLLDKIRYEEATGKEMEVIFRNYYGFKKDFLSWIEKKKQSTDIIIDWLNIEQNSDIKNYELETNNQLIYFWKEINSFNQFRNKTGKKDRNDHRHHAIDAFIIACCSPKIIKTLSTYNAAREREGISLYDEFGRLTREKIEKCFDTKELIQSIASILVSHYEKQILIKKRINRIKNRNGIIKAITYAPQGSLHKESFYGKQNGDFINRSRLYDDKRQDKILFEELKDLDYQGKGEKWHKIPEIESYEAIKRRIEELGKKALSRDMLEKEPLFMSSSITPNKKESKKGKPLPIIKSVRQKINIKRSMIQLPSKDKEGNVIFENRWVNSDSKYIMVFFRNGEKRFSKPFSFFDAVQRKRKAEQLIPDEVLYKNESYGIDKSLPWLKIGDIVFLCVNDEHVNNINWNDKNMLSIRLYKVKSFSSSEDKKNNVLYEYSYVYLLNLKKAKDSGYPSQTNISEAIKLPSFKISHIKFNAIKVRLNSLGEITAKGEECF